MEFFAEATDILKDEFLIPIYLPEIRYPKN